MKKFLLFASMCVLAVAGAQAVTDNQTYETTNDIQMKNLWILDRVHTPDVFTKLEACNTRARTAVMHDGVVYVARSEAKSVIIDQDTISASVIYRFDAETGTELDPLDVTLDGKPYGVFLGVNSITVDNFGHLCVMPYISELANEIPFYQLNPETGELTLIATVEKGDKIARTDYYDVMGDITREQAECNVMAAGTNEATVYRWHADKGGSFEGGFEGDTYLDITDFYPETVTQWGYGPRLKMVLGDSDDNKYAGELFYVDGFSSAPILYSTDGSLIESFENVASELFPEAGTNGVSEFTLDGRNFIIYSIAQYSGAGHGCQANICELNEGSLAGMKKYWQIPADSLGNMSDGGNRVHCFNVEKSTDASGNEVAMLFNFKCYNGMGVYKIGKNLDSEPSTGLAGDVNLDGQVNSGDIACVVNIATGKDPAGTYGTRDDVNGDGQVNSGDIAAIVAIMTGN